MLWALRPVHPPRQPDPRDRKEEQRPTEGKWRALFSHWRDEQGCKWEVWPSEEHWVALGHCRKRDLKQSPWNQKPSKRKNQRAPEVIRRDASRALSPLRNWDPQQASPLPARNPHTSAVERGFEEVHPAGVGRAPTGAGVARQVEREDAGEVEAGVAEGVGDADRRGGGGGQAAWGATLEGDEEGHEAGGEAGRRVTGQGGSKEWGDCKESYRGVQ